MHESEPEPIPASHEAARDSREAPARAEVPNMRQHAPGRMHRIARRQHRPLPMRHLRELPLLLPPPLLPPPTPRRKLQLHLLRLDLRPAHFPSPPPPALQLARGEI